MHQYLITFEQEGEENQTLVSAASREAAIELWLGTGDESHVREALETVVELPPVADQPTVHDWWRDVK